LILDFLLSVDPLWQYLLEGDFLGFITACYTLLIGEGFYAYLMLVTFGIVYLRTRSLTLIAIMWTIMGTFFIILAPVISHLVLILWALGITGILWSLYKGRKG